MLESIIGSLQGGEIYYTRTYRDSDLQGQQEPFQKGVLCGSGCFGLRSPGGSGLHRFLRDTLLWTLPSGGPCPATSPSTGWSAKLHKARTAAPEVGSLRKLGSS